MGERQEAITGVALPYTVITVSVLSSGSLATRREHLVLPERFCNMVAKKENIGIIK
jgi:hypothetical protein